jgi:peptide/nickel transport system permease protein
MRRLHVFLLSIAGFWFVMIAIAFMVDINPDEVMLKHILKPPSIDLWFGADDLGRAVFDRLIAGAGISISLAFVVVSISVVTGTFIGIISAYAGGTTDSFIMRITDIFLAFPGILLAIALAGVLGPGLMNIVIALTAVGWVGFARLARSQVLALKHYDHVTAAIALGQRTPRLLLQHILPLILAPVLVEASFALASVMIAEAGLSFLGLGVQPPQASWGSMIRDGSRYLLVAPHLTVFPGLALMSVVLFFNLSGDALRDRLDRV